MTNSKKIQLGDCDFSIAAFSFKQLEEHQDDITLLMTGFNWSDAGHRAALLRVLTAASERAGDAITADDLAERLDISNAHDVVMAFFNRNGFGRKDDAKGEAQAAPSAN
jgi:hypothetical protein